MDLITTLIKERDNLKNIILADFKETFEHYAPYTNSFDDILFEEEEIQNWKEDWLSELTEINDLSNIINKTV